MKKNGFQEIEHTADVAVRVWATTLEDLFKEAAKSIYAIAGIQMHEDEERTKEIILQADDLESLFVQFLSEMLFCLEEEIVFHSFNITITNLELKADLRGNSGSAIEKEIKAITYHDLAIEQREDGFSTIVVMDL